MTDKEKIAALDMQVWNAFNALHLIRGYLCDNKIDEAIKVTEILDLVKETAIGSPL